MLPISYLEYGTVPGLVVLQEPVALLLDQPVAFDALRPPMLQVFKLHLLGSSRGNNKGQGFMYGFRFRTGVAPQTLNPKPKTLNPKPKP